MEKLNTKNVAITTGYTVAAVHTLAVIGSRIGLLGYSEWVHMMNFSMTLQPFNITAFIAGIVTAFVIGAVIGTIFATIYNKVR